MIEEDYIIKQILSHLQGYIIESDSTDDIISDLEYDKKISREELFVFHNVAKSYLLSYINRLDLPQYTHTKVVDGATVTVTEVPPMIYTAWDMWTAGLIWEKYNVREQNNEDETNTLGYGDKLIIRAKEILKPFKYYRMDVY